MLLFNLIRKHQVVISAPHETECMTPASRQASHVRPPRVRMDRRELRIGSSMIFDKKAAVKRSEEAKVLRGIRASLRGRGLLRDCWYVLQKSIVTQTQHCALLEGLRYCFGV